MLPRFLADSIDVAAGVARLSDDEARHLAQVLRLAAGDEVAVFDGAGREFRARIERVGRDGAELRLLEQIGSAPEPAVRLTLAQAVIKGEKMDDVVRDATMMGVTAIEPLLTEHTAAHIKAGRAPERWRRIAVASAKQCRRAVVPAIGAGTAFADWLARDRAEIRVLLVEPSAESIGRALPTLGSAPAGHGFADGRARRRVERERDRLGRRCRLHPDHARPPHAPRRRRPDRCDCAIAVRLGRRVARFAYLSRSSSWLKP